MDKKYLVFFKVETTGLPDYSAPSESDNQPHIVSLAALKVDAETREVIQTIDSVVKPNGWDVPQESIDLHGITLICAEKIGLPEGLVLDDFVQLQKGCEVISHSAAFAARILRIAHKRYHGDKIADEHKEKGYTCTAKMVKDVVKIPAAKAGTYKQPTLAEAYQYFKGAEFLDAKPRTAIYGAHACMDIYFGYKDLLK
jgi:DNA polymerase-3 subunit epsilon